MMHLDTRQTIASIVLDHPASARIFQSHRIDFCCRGQATLEAACAEKGLDPVAVARSIEAALADRAGRDEDPRTLSTPALLARIVERHHGYLRQALPFLVPLSIKVARVHGDKEPRLGAIRDLVIELKEMLEPHLAQEEEVLFPALAMRTPDPAVIRSELADMHADHLAVGERLGALRRLTDDFTAPAWACNSYRTLFAELSALEGDILQHVHTENHVLMPRFAAS